MHKTLLIFLFGTLCASEPPKKKCPSLRDLAIQNMARILVEKSVDNAELVFGAKINPNSFSSDFREHLHEKIPTVYSEVYPILKIFCAEIIIEKLNKEVSSLDYNDLDQKRKSLLHCCAKQPNEWHIQLLLEFEITSVNQADAYGNTSLYYAVKQGHIPTIEILLKFGANSKTCNRLGYTVPSIAIENNRLDILQLLIKNDSLLPSYIDKQGYHLFHYALMYPQIDAEAFLSYLSSLNGIDINVPSSNGDTPLHIATIKRPDAIKLLLEAGADKTTPDNMGKLPRYYAADKQSEKLLKLSLKQKLKVQCSNCLIS